MHILPFPNEYYHNMIANVTPELRVWQMFYEHNGVYHPPVWNDDGTLSEPTVSFESEEDLNIFALKFVG